MEERKEITVWKVLHDIIVTVSKFLVNSAALLLFKNLLY